MLGFPADDRSSETVGDQSSVKSLPDQNVNWQSGSPLPADVIWIDLLNPTDEERTVTVRIPSEEALSEIEASSRLILDHNLLYLSSPAVTIGENSDAELTPVGFIIGPKVIVTVRFSPLPTFDSVVNRLATDESLQNGMCVFTALLEAILVRAADVLELLGAQADQLSRSVFKSSVARNKGPVRSTRRLREALSSVGVLADRLAKARDVLLGVGRIASFASDVGGDWVTKSSRLRLDAVSKDVVSLSDYETRLSDKIQLLLDTVLGFISIEQNDLFKVLTIASVVGIPPTLLAGIWGMNLRTCPG